MENHAEKPSGPAVAAIWATGLGLLALAISQILADAHEPAKVVIHNIGKTWMPGAGGIGPYSGKETIALLVWLISWVILHFFLRRRQLNLMISGTLFLILIGLATTLVWPPVTHQVIHFCTG